MDAHIHMLAQVVQSLEIYTLMLAFTVHSIVFAVFNIFTAINHGVILNKEQGMLNLNNILFVLFSFIPSINFFMAIYVIVTVVKKLNKRQY